MIQSFLTPILKRTNQSTILFYHYFFLLIGFFGGNLWGSFFSSFSLPPFFFVIGLVVCLETLSYLYYKKISYKKIPKFAINFKIQFLSKNNKKMVKRNVATSLTIVENRTKVLYLLKIGLVFGLFVDAFKVGS